LTNPERILYSFTEHVLMNRKETCMKSEIDSIEGAPRSRIGNFSLIELMLCISVVAILSSTAAPALIKAREKATQINCSNNLRQLAIASNIYLSDNRSLPCSNRFLDDFTPLYTYVNTLKVFNCAANPYSKGRLTKQEQLLGGTDYLSNYLGENEFPSSTVTKTITTTTEVTVPSEDSGNNGHSNGLGSGCGGSNFGNGGTNGKGNNAGAGNNNGNGYGSSNGGGNADKKNGNNGKGNGKGNSSGETTTQTVTTTTEVTSREYAYSIDPADEKFQRIVADKIKLPVLYDFMGPAHNGTYINVCYVLDTSVKSQRDMCNLWILDSSRKLILDSITPFPTE